MTQDECYRGVTLCQWQNEPRNLRRTDTTLISPCFTEAHCLQMLTNTRQMVLHLCDYFSPHRLFLNSFCQSLFAYLDFNA